MSETTPQPWPSPFTHLVGFDWANEQHVVCVMSPAGTIRLRLTFAHDVDGWRKLREELAKLGPLETIAVAIETSSGIIVEQLLDMGVAVYPVPPVQMKGFRIRKAPSGVKDDELDARCLADALRTDGYAWRRLKQDGEAIRELRALCRDEISLIDKRTALYNELTAALKEYFPAVLEAFGDVKNVAVLDFLVQFPDQPTLTKKGKRAWEKFLHTHRMGDPKHYQRRLAVFAGASSWKVPTPTVRAKSRLAAALVAQIRLLNSQLREYREQIEKLFDNHDDAGIFDSLPGAGRKLAPRLLAFLGSDRSRFESVESLQCYAGTAPVTEASGRSRWVHVRHACDKYLRATLHLWAEQTIVGCTWARVYYDAKRQKMSHAMALRALAQRWLKILWKMWTDRKPYDEAIHTRNQVKHGSWILKLATEPGHDPGKPVTSAGAPA